MEVVQGTRLLSLFHYSLVQTPGPAPGPDTVSLPYLAVQAGNEAPLAKPRLRIMFAPSPFPHALSSAQECILFALRQPCCAPRALLGYTPSSHEALHGGHKTPPRNEGNVRSSVPVAVSTFSLVRHRKTTEGMNRDG